MEIKRDIYLNKLIERKQNGLIKIVTGLRRAGKSYLQTKPGMIIFNTADFRLFFPIEILPRRPNTLRTFWKMSICLISLSATKSETRRNWEN